MRAHRRGPPAALLLLALLAGCPGPVGSGDADLDARATDAPSMDAPVDARGPDVGMSDTLGADTALADTPAGDAPTADVPADAGCVPTGDCVPGSTDCVDDATALRCVEGAACEFAWNRVPCPPMETCGLLRDGRRDCAPLSEHVCSDDRVPVYGFPCGSEGASYCTSDRRAAYVCRAGRDIDTCLDVAVEPCLGDDECTNAGAGSCACQNRCTAGQLRCGLDLVSVQVCGDADGDGCMEWDPPTACAPGLTCLATTGTCSSTCSSDCAALGPVGCFRSPVSVGECGFFDSDPCRDLRFDVCPAARPICDVLTRSCAECLGGIDCAPAIESCVANTCTPPAGTCFLGEGSSVRVPAGIAPGDVTLFVGLRLPGGGPLFATLFLNHPDGTLVDVRTDLLRDGYSDSIFTTLTGAMQPEIAALGTRPPAGTWQLRLIPSGGPAVELATWAICID